MEFLAPGDSCRPRRAWLRRGVSLLSLAAGLQLFRPALSAEPASPPAANPAATSPATAGEYQLKAVFLFNFTKYVEWPSTAFADAQAPFVIGILGDDPFGATLDEIIRGEKVNGRALVVRRYGIREEAKDCQILFISRNATPRLEQIVDGLKGRSVLTVGDADKFTDRGGMIGLVTDNNKIHLKINLEAAKTAGLTISSNLLRAAEITARPKE